MNTHGRCLFTGPLAAPVFKGTLNYTVECSESSINLGIGAEPRALLQSLFPHWGRLPANTVGSGCSVNLSFHRNYITSTEQLLIITWWIVRKPWGIFWSAAGQDKKLDQWFQASISTLHLLGGMESGLCLSLRGHCDRARKNAGKEAIISPILVVRVNMDRK
jgi:hypothetical protein